MATKDITVMRSMCAMVMTQYVLEIHALLDIDRLKIVFYLCT